MKMKKVHNNARDVTLVHEIVLCGYPSVSNMSTASARRAVGVKQLDVTVSMNVIETDSHRRNFCEHDVVRRGGRSDVGISEFSIRFHDISGNVKRACQFYSGWILRYTWDQEQYRRHAYIA